MQTSFSFDCVLHFLLLNRMFRFAGPVSAQCITTHKRNWSSKNMLELQTIKAASANQLKI